MFPDWFWMARGTAGMDGTSLGCLTVTDKSQNREKFLGQVFGQNFLVFLLGTFTRAKGKENTKKVLQKQPLQVKR